MNAKELENAFDTIQLPSNEEKEISQQEQLALILQEIRSLRQEIQKIDQLEAQVKDIRKVVKGGKQPNKKLKVVADSGEGPGCAAIAKVMKEARSGGKYDGIEVGKVENILEDYGYDRRRKAVLNNMRKIANSFDGFKFRSGNSTRGSELHYQPGVNGKPTSTNPSESGGG